MMNFIFNFFKPSPKRCFLGMETTELAGGKRSALRYRVQQLPVRLAVVLALCILTSLGTLAAEVRTYTFDSGQTTSGSVYQLLYGNSRYTGSRSGENLSVLTFNAGDISLKFTGGYQASARIISVCTTDDDVQVLSATYGMYIDLTSSTKYISHVQAYNRNGAVIDTDNTSKTYSGGSRVFYGNNGLSKLVLTLTDKQVAITGESTVDAAPGSKLTPAFTLSSGYAGTPTYSSDNTDVATVDANTGEVTAVQVGTANITVTCPTAGDWCGNTFTYQLAVKKPVTLSATSLTVDMAASSFTTPSLPDDYTGTVAYSSSNTAVTEVDATTGVLNLKSAGTATINLDCAGDDSYAPTKLSYALKVTQHFLPAFATAVKKSVGKTAFKNAFSNLPAGYDGTITYSSGNADMATVAADGTVTPTGKKGTATITATLPATDYYQPSAPASYTFNTIADMDNLGNCLIGDAQTLADFAEIVNGGQNNIDVLLTADIDFTDYSKDNTWPQISSYGGIFDGGNHTIKNFNQGCPEGSAFSFILNLTNNGEVKYLFVQNPFVFVQQHGLGTIVNNNKGYIHDVWIEGGHLYHGNQDHMGGIVGVNRGRVKDCAVKSLYIGNRWGGNYTRNLSGICGINEAIGTITNCMSFGNSYVRGNGKESSVCAVNSGTIENTFADVFFHTDDSCQNTILASKAQFANGEIAYKLNAWRQYQVWGQNIGTDNSPMLTADNHVFKVDFSVGGSSKAQRYANTGGTVTLPTKEELGQTAYNLTLDGQPFSGSVGELTGDITVDVTVGPENIGQESYVNDVAVSAGKQIVRLVPNGNEVDVTYDDNSTETAGKASTTLSYTAALGDKSYVEAENARQLLAFGDRTVDVKVFRTLTTGQWNTLCLPFDMSEEQIAATWGEGTIVAVYRTQNSADNLDFAKTAAITAGRPCIIWPAQTVEAFTVNNVALQPITAAGSTTNGNWTLKGTMAASLLLSTNDEIRYFAKGNELKTLSANGTIKPMRAYLEANTATAKTITFSVDGLATGIATIAADGRICIGNQGVYDLNGRYLGATTDGLSAGVYIVNGNKTIKK